MNSDFKDLLAEFNAHSVEFIVVGAHALAAHGCVRATKDLDVWIRPDGLNAVRVVQALKAFGAPLHDVTEDDFSVPGATFQIGIPPLRIDILTEISGVTFAEAWPARMLTKFANEPVAVLSKDDLIRNKLASARKQDLADVEWLQNTE